MAHTSHEELHIANSTADPYYPQESETKRLESKLGDVGGRLEGERSRAEKLEVVVREKEQGRH